MAKVSDAVNGAIARMYAIMATAAAQRALEAVRQGCPSTAIAAAGNAEDWLKRAGATATRYSYRDPK